MGKSAETLLNYMKQDEIPTSLLKECFESVEWDERAFAYEIATGAEAVKVTGARELDRPYEKCLDYLLDSISRNLAETPLDSFQHSKGDAMFELARPLVCQYLIGAKPLTPERFWSRLGAFLSDELDRYEHGIVTHFLEGPSIPGQRAAIKAWRRDPVLARYVDETEKVDETKKIVGRIG